MCVCVLSVSEPVCLMYTVCIIPVDGVCESERVRMCGIYGKIVHVKFI